MKIDDDLIFERYEQIRNELVTYINNIMNQTERNDHGQNLMEIIIPFRGFISELKMEQMERDSYEADETDKLNQERIKYFEF